MKCVAALVLSVGRSKTVVCVACSPWLMLDATFPECLSPEQHGAGGSFHFLESEEKLVNRARYRKKSGR